MSHGVNIQEQPTGVKPPVQVSASLPVYTGTAPVGAGDPTCVNKPIRCNTLAEFVAKFGPLSSDFASWTLHEAADAHFRRYGVAPIVCINVLDPENDAHVASATGESHQLVDGEVKLQTYGGADVALLGVLKDTVVVSGAVLDTDYTLAFDKDGYLVVSIIEGGALAEDDVISVSFDYLDASGVTADDIIGGYSAGQYTGLEVVKQVYPALRLVPGFVLAPKWSQVPEVAARIGTLSRQIGAFRAIGLVDLSTDPSEIESYADAGAWKADNGYSSENLIPCWPKVKLGDDVYHASTHVACVAALVDSANGGVPFASPSNKAVQATSCVDDDGNEILLDRDQANALNSQGIVTVLNGANGFRTWGNRTGGYPGNTDPKDAFIPIRRMFNWMGNTIQLTTDRDVDEPGNRRLIDRVNGTLSSWLNGLVALGALVFAEIEFRADENPLVDLSDGKIVWHVTATPPSPGEQLWFLTEYDPAGLAALFAT